MKTQILSLRIPNWKWNWRQDLLKHTHFFWHVFQGLSSNVTSSQSLQTKHLTVFQMLKPSLCIFLHSPLFHLYEDLSTFSQIPGMISVEITLMYSILCILLNCSFGIHDISYKGCLPMKCWGKLHNEELYNFYSSPYIKVIKSRRKKWLGQSNILKKWIGQSNVYKISVRKPQEKKILGRPSQEDNIKTEQRNRL
jgi:hypothetical protein